MGKSDKNKRGKVPKITEAEYTAYVNRLRELSETGTENCVGVEPQGQKNENVVK